MTVILITVQLKETEAYLHLHQSHCPVQGPLQMCSCRTPLKAGWCTRTPCLLCQTRAVPHLGSHLPASRTYCSDECDPHVLSPAVNKGSNIDLKFWSRNIYYFINLFWGLDLGAAPTETHFKKTYVTSENCRTREFLYQT